MQCVFESAIIGAPADEVWDVIGEFRALADWHPGVTSSELQGGFAGNQPGAFRSVQLSDGATLMEYLKAHSDDARSYTYLITAGPLPIHGYESTITVRPVTETNQSFVEWSSVFTADSGEEEAMSQAIRGVYTAGLGALKDRFAK